ncbi:hypothetical protein JOC85_003392 [Bacillus mesophilus]|uniref:Uncharacterized protein n=1 Tax=Bacillus mesophilus TaxID=1808955 RepID=A0A6M0QCU1_9BACI|nr:hypothetical protein [Bacillus mesophilus]MBM7662582.1 hypothetical protein [Bacillus mesophilus]NEY73350.1 hypothetical protein [Bacillus mesophilus]
MNQTCRIYIQYQIKSTYIKEYENMMKKVIDYLPSLGANQIDWYNCEQDTYLESFSLPTVSHFVALKKLRNKRKHSIFGMLDQFIEGGIENIQIHAIKVQ